jgi:hypothetical protein
VITVQAHRSIASIIHRISACLLFSGDALDAAASCEAAGVASTADGLACGGEQGNPGCEDGLIGIHFAVALDAAGNWEAAAIVEIGLGMVRVLIEATAAATETAAKRLPHESHKPTWR